MVPFENFPSSPVLQRINQPAKTWILTMPIQTEGKRKLSVTAFKAGVSVLQKQTGEIEISLFLEVDPPVSLQNIFLSAT